MERPAPAAHTVDARGRFCPMPTLLAALTLEKMRPGDILELHGDDPSTRRDLPAWCVESGHRFLGFGDAPAASFVARIQKS